MSLSLSKARVFVASVLLAGGGALVLPQVAAAQSNLSSVSCEGLSVSFRMFTSSSNSVTVIVNGASQTHTFNGEFGLFVPFNPNESNTWSYAVTSSESDGNFANSGTEAGCVEEPPTTEAPSTTEAPTTTEAPATTEPAPTTTAGIGPTTPTSAPVATTGPVVSVLAQVAATTPAADPNDPAGETSGLNQTLPETGSNSGTSVAVGGFLVLLGGAAMVAGRRKPNLAD